MTVESDYVIVTGSEVLFRLLFVPRIIGSIKRILNLFHCCCIIIVYCYLGGAGLSKQTITETYVQYFLDEIL